MKKKLLAKVAKLAMLTFAAVIVVTGSDVMTVEAKRDTSGWTTGSDGTPVEDLDDDSMFTDNYDYKTEDEIMEEAREAAKELEALMRDRYSDVNTLNATVKMSKNILKAKKKAGAYVKQTPKPSKVVVNGKALKSNKKTLEYAVAYHLWNEEKQEWQVAENGITSPGLYRMWIRGYKDNANRYYAKRIYVYDTADKVKPMSSVKVKVNKVPYTGEAITSDVIKSVKLGKTTLTEGKDYTVTYLNNVNSGTGIVRLTAVDGSGLVGEKEVNFKITDGIKINKAKVTGLTNKTYNYGKAVTQDMSQVKLTVKGTELNPETDYAVQYYMNNTKVGTAKIVITGKGKYYGTITKSFKITKVPITEEMLDEASKNKVKPYTGKAVKTDVGLYDSNRLIKSTSESQPEPYQLKEKTDYTLSYKNNVKPSDKAVIIVKGKGNYTGKITVYFTIQDKSKSADTQKATEKDSVTKPETDEEVTDTPEETVTDEEVTDVTDEPADTEESENDETPDTEENPADDETPADDGTDNTGSDDADNTTSDDTDNTGSDDADDITSGETGSTGSDDADDTTSDETGNTDSEDADNTTSGETGNTGSEDAGDTTSDETDNTDSDDADNTASDDTGSTDSDDISNNASDDTNDVVSDNAVTSPETRVSEDADAA